MNDIPPAIADFITDCRQLLGPEHVVAGGHQLEKISRDPVYSCHPPTAAVFPGNVEEVSETVKLANRHGVALWVYSTARNWGYGNTCGRKSDVVLILSRMNRILAVDTELAFAELEPGVTYAQLNGHLRENHIPLWTDCTGGPPSGSVIGNALDRGFGVTPYGDHFAHLCGLEIVLADGSVVRTGGFGDENHSNGAWHTFQRSAGPVLEGLFSQSNFGIVVKAGLWLMPAPETLEIGNFRIDRPEDLPEALDTMRTLILKGDLIGKGRFSNDIASLTLLTQLCLEDLPERDLAKPRPLSPEELQILRKRHGIAPWTAAYGLYGSRPLVKVAKKQCSLAFRKFGKHRFIGPNAEQRIKWLWSLWQRNPDGFVVKLADFLARRLLGLPLEGAFLVPRFFDIHRGIPNESVVRRAYFYHPEPRPESDIDVAAAGIGVLWFVPLLPFRGREIVNYIESCREIFHRHGHDHSVSITPVNHRTVVPLMVILYNRNSPASCQTAGKLYEELQSDALAKGYQQFRCGEPGWEHLLAANPELKALQEKLKETLDPKGVLSPGRYGIGNRRPA